MAYELGTIPVRWTEQELEKLEYFYEPFNDPTTIDHWTNLWGYPFRTGLQADFRSPQPIWVEQTIQDLAASGFKLYRTGSSFYKMRPGDILPRHADTYARYCQHHGVQSHQVWRAIVFLQDWQPGFLFEIDDQAIAGYKNGTYVIWHDDAPHLAGNIGNVPRYTLQITGVRVS